ncbi:MAG: T9SS type A sorting domain-containing protein [Bacteroidota bacterium]
MLTAEAKSACASSSRSIIIYGGPLSPGVISGSDAVCSGGVEEYTVDGSHGATYYEWTVPSGTTILGGQGTGTIIVLFGSVSGYIMVNASNDCDTSDADSLNVTVNSCRQAQQAYTDKGLRAYPNPTSGIVTLKFGAMEEKKYELQISDVTGNILNTIKGTSVKGINSIDLNLVNYSKGIYLIKINTSDHYEVIRISLQ